MTITVLMIAPLESNVQIELIISILEYSPTPKVAAKKLHPLIIIDFMEVSWAIQMASFLLFPFPLSF